MAFALEVVAPGHHYAFLGARGPRRQIGGVQEEGQEFDAGQAAGAEGLVALAQFSTDAADAAPGHAAQARLLDQALDVAVGEAAHVSADDQRLQRPRTDGLSGVRDRAADEGLDGPPELRHLEDDLAFGRLQALGAAAVAPAACLVRALVAGAGQEGCDLVFERSLEHELSAETAKPAEALAVVYAGLEKF